MIRGNLEATELGITTPEADFLANFVLPDGGTVRESSVYRHRVVAMDDDGNQRVTKRPQKRDATRKGIANMSWSELISSGVAAVAVAIAFVSLIVSYRAHQMDPDPSPAQHNRPACLVQFRKSVVCTSNSNQLQTVRIG